MLNAVLGPHGYYPVRLGFQFKGHNIVRKLEWGTTAGVWLAKEQTGKRRFVVLKVLNINATYGNRTSRMFEMEIVKKLGGIVRAGVAPSILAWSILRIRYVLEHLPCHLGNLPLEQRLKNKYFSFLREQLSQHDFEDTCRFLRRCFTIHPARRPTASELLQDPWLLS
ncbi:hypothetical protein GY45DRAFT_916653 [Cubamyces sp. BRFM 1775]|nr:hypothetical protein GY45DRAFT_916653 [Cubamyces sp. BRFM 1775]